MITDQTFNEYSKITGLMIAALRGNMRIVRSLLEYGGAVNILTARGSALSLAAESKEKKVIKRLLQNRADPMDAILALSTLAPIENRCLCHDNQRRAIRRLKKIVEENPQEVGQAEELLRLLHVEFSNEHRHILNTIKNRKDPKPRVKVDVWGLGLFS